MIFNLRVPTDNSTLCGEIPTILMNEYGYMSPFGTIKKDLGDIPCFVRLCAQIYTELDDFEDFGKKVLKIIEESKIANS